MKASAKDACPCGSATSYAACCGQWHSGYLAGRHAPTPEQLMRSRYTAFALKLENYLLATWHPDTRPASLNLEQEPALKWVELKVLRAEGNMVAFTARYKVNGKAEKLHEVSRFEQVDGVWYYLDGTLE